MYRLGITPWVHREPPEPLAALIEGPQSLPPGDMRTPWARATRHRSRPGARPVPSVGPCLQPSATEVDLRGPVRNARPSWHQLVRR